MQYLFSTPVLLCTAVVLALLSGAARGQTVCGDGIKTADEECDVGGLYYGCDTNCTIEPGFSCVTLTVNGTSQCNLQLFDLNKSDGDASTDGLPLVLVDQEEFLLHPDDVIIADNRQWDSVSVVILQDVGNDASVSLDIQLARNQGRLKGYEGADNSRIRETRLSDPLLESILGVSEFAVAFIFEPLSPNATQFAGVTLFSMQYDSHSETDFTPRNVCMVAIGGANITVGCIEVRFEGRDDDRPVIMYNREFDVSFIEGQTDPVFIFNDTVNVTDPDHPTFLLQRAEAQIITNYDPQERLGLASNFTGFNASFNGVNGLLSITGEGTPEMYSWILGNITYYTSMPEPVSRTRTIRVEVFDSVDPGVPENSIVIVININDKAVVNFGNGTLTTYYEGNGSVVLAPSLIITDPDPGDMVTSVVAELTEVYDGQYERLLLPATSGDGVNISIISYHRIELSGVAESTVYDLFLRQLMYQHTDVAPGNPTPGTRTVTLNVTDRHASALSTLHFTIQPINDPPVLSFASLNATASNSTTGQYTEDDPPLRIFSNLSLVDVDSNITQAVITLSGLLDGEHDLFTFSDSLVGSTGVNITTHENNGTRTLTLMGSNRVQVFEMLLQSFIYQNTFTNNSVTDGNRSVHLTVTDAAAATSNTVTAIVTVVDRNDEPNVRFDDTIFFTEGNIAGIFIVTVHLVRLLDEEGNGISNMTVTLSSPNGELDEEERLIRTSFPELMVSNDGRQIVVRTPGTVDLYEQYLGDIKYINPTNEPTYFVNGTTSGELLRRRITITITDDHPSSPSTLTQVIEVNTTIINDNAPRLILQSDCPVDPPQGIFPVRARRRRDVSAVHRPHKLLQLKKKSSSEAYRHAPKVVSAIPHYSRQRCLTNITITFSTSTSVPPVEKQRDLQDVLSLQPSQLNAVPHRGVWLDTRRLAVLFDGCYQFSNSDHLQLVFEDQQGSCSSTTRCTSGICYSNKTGCPLIGLVPIPLIPSRHTRSVTPESHSQSWVISVTPYLSVGLVAVTIVSIIAIVMFILQSRLPRSRQQSPVSGIHPPIDKLSLVSSSAYVETLTADSTSKPVKQTQTTDTMADTSVALSPDNLSSANEVRSDERLVPVSSTVEKIDENAEKKSKVKEKKAEKEEEKQEKQEERKLEEEAQDNEHDHSVEIEVDERLTAETLSNQLDSGMCSTSRSQHTAHQHTTANDVAPAGVCIGPHQHAHTVTHRSGRQQSPPQPHTNRHTPRLATSDLVLADHRGCN